MAQHTNPTSVLLPQFLTLLDAHRAAFRQARTAHRLAVLAIGLLCAFSRHALAQMLVALGLGNADWSAAYRLFSLPRLDSDQLTRCFPRQTLPHVPPDQPYLVALDGVQVPRRSRRMPGTSWLHDPHAPPFRRGIHRVQRLSHLAWLTPPTLAGFARAIPLRWLAGFPAKAMRPAGMVAQKEWGAGLASLVWLRTELDAAGRQAQAVLAVADGVYSDQQLWRQLLERVQLLARGAQNRALYGLQPARVGRGRLRKHGERAPTPQAWLAERDVRRPAAPVPPLGRWWAGSGRWSFGQLWQGIRQELWEVHEFPHSVQRILTNGPEKGLWLPAWAAAALAARRG